MAVGEIFMFVFESIEGANLANGHSPRLKILAPACNTREGHSCQCQESRCWLYANDGYLSRIRLSERKWCVAMQMHFDWSRPFYLTMSIQPPDFTRRTRWCISLMTFESVTETV